MSIKIRKEIIFLLSFLLALAAYWPSMHGTPIWDDFHFWFADPVMGDHMSYWTIWSRFGWPFSVSIQKFMLKVLDKNYFYYHLINFLLHFCNSLLVYKLGRVLRFKNPILFFLLFLFHPVAVITTSWMVQIKTLLCFFFALSSLLCFFKGEKNIRWMMLSWIFFGLSITSKSASVSLPVILFIIHFKIYRFKKIWLLIPFILLSAWNTYRVLKSPVTKEGKEKAEVISKIKETPQEVTPVVPPKAEVKPIVPTAIPEPVIIEKPKKASKVSKKIKERPAPAAKITPKIIPKTTEQPVVPEIKPENPVETTSEQPKDSHQGPPVVTLDHKAPQKPILNSIDIDLIIQTLHYYFWQTFLPMNNVPVRGLNFQSPNFENYLHLFFLFTMIFILWKDSALLYLVAGHFLLLPFLGIIKAPYMNITWVSDQHLYLILPCFLAFGMRLYDKITWKYATVFPLILAGWFTWQTFQSTPYYQDEITFYKKSLEYNPTNVPIAYNLAFAKVMKGDIGGAMNVIETTIILSQINPVMRKNYFYPYLLDLRNKLD